MANVRTLFFGTEKSKSNLDYIEIEVNEDSEIELTINNDDRGFSYIMLDKSTAIRFAKELRKHIGNLNSIES